jgi:hypothetical protein
VNRSTLKATDSGLVLAIAGGGFPGVDGVEDGLGEFGIDRFVSELQADNAQTHSTAHMNDDSIFMMFGSTMFD